MCADREACSGITCNGSCGRGAILNFSEYLMYKIENDMETEPERWTEATKQMKVKEHRYIRFLLNDPSLIALQNAQASTGKQGCSCCSFFCTVHPPPGPRS